jgi:hypothetical protein
MTAALGTSRGTAHRQPVALCVLVGAAVAVGWVLYRHYAVDDVSTRILRWGVIGDRLWLVDLVLTLLLCVPYAVVVLLWGRDLGRATAGAVVAVATGVFVWGLDRVFQNYVWDDPGHPSQASLRMYEWGDLLVVAALVPLAWGLARRAGRRWLIGILAGPVVAAVLREMRLRWSWWHDRVSPFGGHVHWQFQAVVFLGPFVLAVLACWALERPPTSPDTGPSA